MSIIEMMKADAEEKGTIFEPIESDDYHVTLSEWLEEVKWGGFIDYDGHGNLATINKKSNSIIQPSYAKGYDFPEWATHIVWYNR
jgi:hypothetical protein